MSDLIRGSWKWDEDKNELVPKDSPGPSADELWTAEKEAIKRDVPTKKILSEQAKRPG